jgi:hypothetical protein
MNLYESWRGLLGSLQGAVVWKMIPPCLMWCIQRERNYRSFEDCERMVVELKTFFFKTLFQRTTTYDYFQISNFLDFLDFLYFNG